MINKKILITGVAGFIGFNLAIKLLKNKSIVYGIDNLDPYYSVKLKKKRVQILKNYKNFYFEKINFSKKNKILNYFKNKYFFCVIHFGAQAGVRYSLKNPGKYIESNFIGFINIIENSINNGVKKIIYASSSSIYGDQKKFPLDEKMKTNPKNIYARTKKLNEEIANDISKKNNISIIGLRLFTVYGEWGRPDMFIMKFLNAIFNKNPMILFNRGNHLRDFTYIDDVTEIIKKLIFKNNKKKHLIFNICSNKPIHLKNIINKIYKFSKQLPKIKKTSFQKADVFKTHGNNSKIKKFLNYKNFTNIDDGLKNTLEWYIKNKIWKY